jgi:hypothetical protein
MKIMIMKRGRRRNACRRIKKEKERKILQRKRQNSLQDGFTTESF